MLDSNHLTSAIPTQMGAIASMTSGLYLNANSLSQAIPTQLGLLVNMGEDLQVTSNVLSSTLPTELKMLQREVFSVASALGQHSLPTELDEPGDSHPIGQRRNVRRLSEGLEFERKGELRHGNCPQPLLLSG